MRSNAKTPAKADGRRQRSEASREKIVHAVLDLIRAGDLTPGAEAVAVRARVGLRTVFRHFDNMESLYRQINALISAEVRPLAARPLSPGDWKMRVAELLERRIVIFERILPFKIAADVHRHRSPFLAEQTELLIQEQRTSLVAVLPKDRRRKSAFLDGLDLLMSFDTWRRLRIDQKLSRARARTVVKQLIDSFIAAP